MMLESAQGEIGQVFERFGFSAKRRGEFAGDLEPRHQNNCRFCEYLCQITLHLLISDVVFVSGGVCLD